MKFVVTIAEEDQLSLEKVDATVTEKGDIDFTITGKISDLDPETLAPIAGADLRPVEITFETAS